MLTKTQSTTTSLGVMFLFLLYISVLIAFFSVQPLCSLCLSGDKDPTTEAQRTQRLHREELLTSFSHSALSDRDRLNHVASHDLVNYVHSRHHSPKHRVAAIEVR